MNVDDNVPAIKADLNALERRILERIEKSETNLLLAFRRWSVSAETHQKVNDLLVRSFDDRLGNLEDRVNDLERRITK
jgi:hypothetical protein